MILRVNVHAFSGIESLDEWPSVKVRSNGCALMRRLMLRRVQTWVERVKVRPAVQIGLKVTPFN